MPLPLLVDKLARGGGAGLERRQLVLLRALAVLLPRKAGEGMATANQLADVSSYSTRWARTTLGELEALGLLEWQRGGVVEGQPAASWFRVNKARLVELIRAGREVYQQLLEQRQAATSQRLRGLWNVRSRGQTRRSRHAEVSSSLSPFGEEAGRQAAPASTSFGVVSTCEHGGDAALLPNGQPRCPSCRVFGAGRPAGHPAPLSVSPPVGGSTPGTDQEGTHDA